MTITDDNNDYLTWLSRYEKNWDFKNPIQQDDSWQWQWSWKTRRSKMGVEHRDSYGRTSLPCHMERFEQKEKKRTQKKDWTIEMGRMVERFFFCCKPSRLRRSGWLYKKMYLPLFFSSSISDNILIISDNFLTFSDHFLTFPDKFLTWKVLKSTQKYSKVLKITQKNPKVPKSTPGYSKVLNSTQ